jgi:L-ascorbate metabolism protein UlaG (beta-lactamase superfamily)
MKISFYAHASFRLEGVARDGRPVAVVTDPYTPGPAVSNYDPIAETADLVIMSSATDTFHSDPSHVTGDPVVVNAVEVPAEGVTVMGVPIRAFQTMESLTYDYGRDPDANAMYLFELDGLRCLHIGDLGNAVDPAHLEELVGQVDVMFALTGDKPTIALDDLDDAIRAIQPKVVIPMHYFHPKGRLKILPVTDFTARYPQEMVTWVGATTLELDVKSLPASIHIFVLEQSR